LNTTPPWFKLPSRNTQVAFFFLSPSFNAFACQECCIALATSTYLCAEDVAGEPGVPRFWTIGDESDTDELQDHNERDSVSVAMWEHIEGESSRGHPGVGDAV
jgi:hypothetical protein